MEEEQRADIAIELFVDGSFVTDKAAPGDIDLIVVVPEEYNFRDDMPPVEYNAVSKDQLRRHYRFDVFIARQNSSQYHQQLDFFQRDSRQVSASRKGILRISL